MVLELPTVTVNEYHRRIDAGVFVDRRLQAGAVVPLAFPDLEVLVQQFLG